MSHQEIHYDDWRHFIQMDKGQWIKLLHLLRKHGLILEKVGGDGPITKYRKPEKEKRSKTKYRGLAQ